MIEDRRNETTTPLTDAGVDREIEQLLAVDPSPEFVAKVRARVADEPAPGTWWSGWFPVAAGATAAAVLVLAVVGSRPAPTVAPSDPVAGARADDVGPAAPFDPVTTPDDERSSSSPPPAPVTAADATVAPPPRPTPDDVATPAPSRPEVPSTLSPGTPPGNPAPQLARVVISQSESAALRRLFARVREERVAVPTPVEPHGSIALLEAPMELVIPPITIEPVTLALLQEGVVQ